MKNTTILDIHDVCRITDLSKPTIYRLMNQGVFPRPVQLSANRVAWRSSDVDNWLENLPVSGGLRDG